jgi:hypothetical protein
MRWTKITDYLAVQFPELCPFSGLKADAVKSYEVTDTSPLWVVMRFLRWYQSITIPVPFSEIGLLEMKKQRRKAALRGLLIGSVIAIAGVVGGITMAVNAPTKPGYDTWIMVFGLVFVFSLILTPVLLVYRYHLKSGPLYFRKKGQQLWVKIRNDDYRKKFRIANLDSILSEDNGQVLDAEY